MIRQFLDIAVLQTKIIGSLPSSLQLSASRLLARRGIGNSMQIASIHHCHGVDNRVGGPAMQSCLPLQLVRISKTVPSCAWRWGNSLLPSAPRHTIGVWQPRTPASCRALTLPTPAGKHSHLHEQSLIQSSYQQLVPFEQTGNFSSSAAGTAGAAVPTSTRVVVMAVDPDTHGAIAVVSWDTTDLSAVVDPKTLKINVYDMPCAQVILQKKSKVTGLNARRRWLDVSGAKAVIKSVLDELYQAATNNNVSIELRAFVESAPVMPFTSRPSTIAPQLHSIGAWHGMLSLAGFKTCTVPAMVWKKDLSLVGLDKEGSLVLAQQMWPQHAHMLQRKKDHGRAEAMLIAAWALGASRPAPTDANPDNTLPKKRRSSKGSIAANSNGKSQTEGGPMSILLSRAGRSTESLNPNHHQNPSSTNGVSSCQQLSGMNAQTNDNQEENANGFADVDLGEAILVANLRAVEQETGSSCQPPSSQSAAQNGEIETAAGLTANTTAGSEKEQIQRLIKVRSSWVVCFGGLRDVKPTDGYGNPFPEGSSEASHLEAPEVEEGNAVEKAPTTRSRRSTATTAKSVPPASPPKVTKRRTSSSSKTTSESKEEKAKKMKKSKDQYIAPSPTVSTRTKQRNTKKAK